MLPYIPIRDMMRWDWGSGSIEAVLAIYIYFNIFDALPTAPGIGSLDSYRIVVRRLTYCLDYDAFTMPHRSFFRIGGQAEVSDDDTIRGFDPFNDLGSGQRTIHQEARNFRWCPFSPDRLAVASVAPWYAS